MPVAEQITPANRRKPSNNGHGRRTTRTLTLRGLVYPDNDAYIAECIDLNIMVRRPSAENAARSLFDAVNGYLETVLSEKSDFQQFIEHGKVDGLIPRPSPFPSRLRYHAYCFKAVLKGNERNFQIVDCPRTFVACHAH